MELRPGAEIDRYVVARRLGAGGNGVVYLAHHRELGTSHAIKLLRWSGGTDERIRREGQLQAALDHPNIARVTDTVRIENQLGLVMEYVDGPTLLERLSGPRLALDEVDALARGILEGVAAAHDRGWVHRDLKPANVLLTAAGVPKITDFGLARITALGEPPQAGTTTRGGLGTRGYMSLEQCSGAPAASTMDVFALGAVLFELVEGHPAFPTVAEWLDAIRTGRYPVLTRTDLPEAATNAIRYALCDLWKRVPDARAVLELWNGAPPPVGAGPTMAPLTDPDLPFTGAPVPIEPHRLPAERDRLVGRDRDLADLQACLLGSDRLITVHGPGGIGKTRLAVRSAWTRYSNRERVWFCDLSGAVGRDGVLHAVARGLSVQLGRDDPVDQLGAVLAQRGRCLVVLDNFEQVVAHGPETVGRWMDAAPDAVFLVTSRIVLGLPGERVIRIEPLDEDAAVALFVDRAVAARRDFAAETGAPAIRELVRWLDGMPLAIELAAARVRLMSPADILERIGDRFRLLAGGSGRPDRQATLRATIGWSWDLLAPWERSALVQVTVFAGGFTLGAVEAVVDLSRWPEVWVVDVLQALVDKSLVRFVGRRFDLFGAIHDFAAEQLEAVQRSEAEARHGRWVVAWSDEATTIPSTTELANLLVATERAVRRGDREVAERAGIAAADILIVEGPVGAAAALLESLRPGAFGGPREAHLLSALGHTLKALGRIDEALERLEAALALHRASGDRREEGVTLSRLGNLRRDRGQRELALELFEGALAAYRETGPLAWEAMALSNVGMTFADLERFPEAEDRYRQSIAAHRAAGDASGEAITLCNLGVLWLRRGRSVEALATLEEALAANLRIGDRVRAAWTRANLGPLLRDLGRPHDGLREVELAVAVARTTGDVRLIGITAAGAAILSEGTPEAEALFAAALVPIRTIGDRRVEGLLLTHLGRSRTALGRIDEAHAAYDRARVLLDGIGEQSAEGVLGGDLGTLYAVAGRHEAATEAFDTAERLLRGTGNLLELARVLCRRAEAATLAGDEAGARSSLAEARGLVSALGLPPESLLVASLVRAEAAL